jgi:hypothetical protein
VLAGTPSSCALARWVRRGQDVPYVRWAKWQPKDGDLILICGHSQKPFHWFVLDTDDTGDPVPLQFERPDGSTGEATWACICDTCVRADLDPQASIVGERRWIGDEPFIEDLAN